jgi:hypothetical protein
MDGVLGWQVGPVPGADTTALEGATIFLEPAEHCNIDCRFLVVSSERLLENFRPLPSAKFAVKQYVLSQVLTRVVNVITTLVITCVFTKKTRNHDLNLRVIT